MFINYKDKKIEITQGVIIGEINVTEETLKDLKKDGLDLTVTNSTICKNGLYYVKSYMPELIRTNKYFIAMSIYSVIVSLILVFLLFS